MAYVKRPVIYGGNGYGLKFDKIDKDRDGKDAAGKGKFRFTITELITGSQNWTNCKFKKANALNAVTIIDLCISMLADKACTFPQHVMIEDRGQSRSGGGQFSYGEFRIILHGRDRAEIVINPKSNDPDKYKKLSFELKPASFMMGNGTEERQVHTIKPALEELRDYIKREYAWWEAHTGGSEEATPPPAQSGGQTVEDDIPF